MCAHITPLAPDRHATLATQAAGAKEATVRSLRPAFAGDWPGAQEWETALTIVGAADEGESVAILDSRERRNRCRATCPYRKKVSVTFNAPPHCDAVLLAFARGGDVHDCSAMLDEKLRVEGLREEVRRIVSGAHEAF